MKSNEWTGKTGRMVLTAIAAQEAVEADDETFIRYMLVKAGFEKTNVVGGLVYGFNGFPPIPVQKVCRDLLAAVDEIKKQEVA